MLKLLEELQRIVIRTVAAATFAFVNSNDRWSVHDPHNPDRPEGPHRALLHVAAPGSALGLRRRSEDQK